MPEGRNLRITGWGDEPTIYPAIAAIEGNSSRFDPPSHHIARGQEMPTRIAIRYYDPQRDYQLGVQESDRRAEGQNSIQLNLPATLNAGTARRFADLRLLEAQRSHNSLSGHFVVGEKQYCPGDWISPDNSEQLFRISEIESFGGFARIEAGAATMSVEAAEPVATPGIIVPPSDLAVGNTHLVVMELPAITQEIPQQPIIALAAAGSEPGWRGAHLALRQGDGLVDLGRTAARATIGRLLHQIGPHVGGLVDLQNEIHVELLHDGMPFLPGTGNVLAADAPMLWIEGELIRYGEAEALGNGRYRLKQLLRGCFGTSHDGNSHMQSSPIVILETETLKILDSQRMYIGGLLTVEATGLGDDEPAISECEIFNLALLPRIPVHGRSRMLVSGGILIEWVRHPRVDYSWKDFVDQPVVEDSEAYLVRLLEDGIQKGEWTVNAPELELTTSTIAALDLLPEAQHELHIYQIGRYGRSEFLAFNLLD